MREKEKKTVSPKGKGGGAGGGGGGLGEGRLYLSEPTPEKERDKNRKNVWGGRRWFEVEKALEIGTREVSKGREKGNNFKFGQKKDDH